MRLTSICVAGILGLLACAAPAARAAEVQVAFDPAGRVLRIDETLARRIGLFVDDHPGFQEARLFAVGDTSFVLEITVIHGNRLERERVPLSPGQAEALRADVVRRIEAAGPPPERLNQDGRTMLVAGNALLGLGFYGWAVPFILDADDPSTALGGYLITSGASTFVPMLLTQNAPVSWPMTNLSLYGSTRGAWHGWLLYDLTTSGGGDSHDNRGRVAVMMATSIAEGVLGYAVARGSRMNGGTAQTVVNGGDYGLLWGVCASDMAGYYDDEDDRMAAMTTLVGATGGTLAFRLLASRRAYSYGDAWVMRSAGYLGMLVATAIADAGDPEGSEPYSAGLIAGSVVGLVAGDRMVEGRDFTGGDGILVQLGGSAGALMGLGLAALSSPQGPRGSTVYWSGAAVGGTIGYALTWRALSTRAAARTMESTSWRFEVDPAGVMQALGRARGEPRHHGGRAVPAAARVICTF